MPAIINKLTNAIEKNLSEVEIWGNGEARREFMYADDFADAIYFSLENCIFFEIAKIEFFRNLTASLDQRDAFINYTVYSQTCVFIH